MDETTTSSPSFNIVLIIIEIVLSVLACITSHCLVRQRDPSLNSAVLLIATVIVMQNLFGLLGWFVNSSDGRILYTIDIMTFLMYDLGFWLPRYFYGKRLYLFLQTRLAPWRIALGWWPVIPFTIYTYVSGSIDLCIIKYNSFSNLQQQFEHSFVYPISLTTTIITLVLVTIIDMYQLRMFYIASKHLHNDVKQHRIMRQLLIGFLVTLVGNSIAGLANMIYPKESVLFAFVSAMGSIFGPMMPVILPLLDKYMSTFQRDAHASGKIDVRTGVGIVTSMLEQDDRKSSDMHQEKKKHKRNSGEKDLTTIANAATLVMSDMA